MPRIRTRRGDHGPRRRTFGVEDEHSSHSHYKHFNWKSYLPTKKHLEEEVKNARNPRHVKMIVVDALPHQGPHDLHFEREKGDKVFFADYSDFITIQPYVNGEHVDEIKEEIGDYQVPAVRSYRGKLFAQDGNHRIEAMHDLGFDRIPVRIAGHDPSPKARTKKDKIGHYLPSTLPEKGS